MSTLHHEEILETIFEGIQLDFPDLSEDEQIKKNLWSIRGVSTMKKGLCIELTQGQYDHLYNIMCSQDEIINYLNESDDFDVQTFDNLFDNICAAKETYLSNTVKGV